jgi:hypothetical protein
MSQGQGRGVPVVLGVALGSVLSLSGWSAGVGLADMAQAAQHEQRSAPDPHLQRALEHNPATPVGLPTYRGPDATDPAEGPRGSLTGSLVFAVMALLTGVIALSLEGQRRGLFLVVAAGLAGPGVALGLFSLVVGMVFSRGPA